LKYQDKLFWYNSLQIRVVWFTESLKKFPELPVEHELLSELAAAFAGWINSDESVNRGIADTSLWAWAFSSFEKVVLENNFSKMIASLGWLITTQNADGSWPTSEARLPLNDGSPNAWHTAGNIQAIDAAIRHTTGGTPVELSIVDPAKYTQFPTTPLTISHEKGQVPLVTGFTLTGNQVTLTEKLPNEYTVHFDAPRLVTGVKLTITDDFSTDGTSSNHWYSGTNARTTPVRVLWVLNEPTEIDAISIAQIDGRHLRSFKVELVTELQPTLTTPSAPVTLQRLSKGAKNRVRLLEQAPKDYVVSFDLIPNATAVKLVFHDDFSSDATSFITEFEPILDDSILAIDTALTTGNAVLRYS